MFLPIEIQFDYKFIMPELLMAKNSFSHTKGHHKNDEPQQLNIFI
jgi:hypothetical protein